jgi:predicted nucleic acid-binding protein
MEPALLGLVLDSSVLIAADRRKLTASETVEIGHGIRANTLELRERRRLFLDELKATVPMYPVTESTAEIIARVGAAQAGKVTSVPLAVLIIGACALELGYAVGARNTRDFSRIPGLDVINL